MSVDVLIAGGGLAGSLAAWRIATLHPTASLLLLEAGATLGGNHTWSFHDSDISPDQRTWLQPLITAQWPRHEVRFPAYTRVLDGGYATVTADRLHAVIAPALGTRLRLSAPVRAVDAHGADLHDGTRVPARLVIDARGGGPEHLPMGWQSFLGQEVRLTRPHGLQWPILMDATVEQRGGYRFIYVLPFTADTLLIEDTYYIDGPAIDADHCRAAIAAYAHAQGWAIAEVLREEAGALPIPLGGRLDDFWGLSAAVPLGVRAGLFQPTTGYSLGEAVATAWLVADAHPGDAHGVYSLVKQHAMARWQAGGFNRLLNRWLFRAAEPTRRRVIFEQFYRRAEPTIARFYAGRLTWPDRLRLLTGRPPVPVSRALAHLRS